MRIVVSDEVAIYIMHWISDSLIVPMAPTDFVDGDGSLDIVPSDVAAALICLVNQQKQKQLDCKNELVREGGLFAKDRKLATKLWRQFMRLESTTHVQVRSKSESMRKVSASLKRSLSLTSEDIETGGVLASNNDGEKYAFIFLCTFLLKFCSKYAS